MNADFYIDTQLALGNDTTSTELGTYAIPGEIVNAWLDTIDNLRLYSSPPVGDCPWGLNGVLSNYQIAQLALGNDTLEFPFNEDEEVLNARFELALAIMEGDI